MKIPKVISEGNSVYIFDQEYPSFFRYINMKTGAGRCFHKTDLIKTKPIRKRKETKWELEEYK